MSPQWKDGAKEVMNSLQLELISERSKKIANLENNEQDRVLLKLISEENILVKIIDKTNLNWFNVRKRLICKNR